MDREESFSPKQKALLVAGGVALTGAVLAVALDALGFLGSAEGSLQDSVISEKITNVQNALHTCPVARLHLSERPDYMPVIVSNTGEMFIGNRH